MIRRLRVWHRRWFVVLAIVLPTLLFLALSDRPRVPTVETLPGVPDAAESSDGEVSP